MAASSGKGTNESVRLTHEEFIRVAIPALRDAKYGKGCHVVFNGLNAAFEQYFGTEARPVIDSLVEQGKFVKLPAKGGVRLFLPEEAPNAEEIAARSKEARATSALAKMGL